jgi:hypothetical protein
MLPSNQTICIHKLALLTALALSVNSLVYAGPLAITNRALNDGAGPDGGRWRGTVALSGTAAFGTDAVAAEVDWAVFAPGRFAQYLTDQGFAGPDPSGGSDAVYAYQVTSVTTALPGISTLTVGLGAADFRGTVLAPTSVSAGPGTVLPNAGGDAGTSMVWTFLADPLNVGQTSGLLVFTSPFAPELDNLSIKSGIATAAAIDEVGSPSLRIVQDMVPEPSSLCLAIASVGFILATRRS